MKKFIVLLLTVLMCLSLTACGQKYVCEQCADTYETEICRNETKPLCRDCYNANPDLSLYEHYCVCGNKASYSTGRTYLCSECYAKVKNAVNGAFAQ